MEPRLTARGITVERSGRSIVTDVSLALGAGDVASIQGASGSGKSTLLRALATLIPARGAIALEGREAHAVGFIAYRRRVAYVPQLPRMFEGSVAENVRAGPAFAGAHLADDAVAALLARVGLAASFAARAAAELSGGEKLRVALARALANEPRVLLLDEPTSALDPEAARVILDLVVSLAKGGTAILAVTHAEEHAARLGGRRFHMRAGVLREGTA